MAGVTGQGIALRGTVNSQLDRQKAGTDDMCFI